MRFIFTAFVLLLGTQLFAQAPALIPYQAIARNFAGNPLASSMVNARFTIHDGTANGISVWQELQTVTTSSLGLFTAQLGSGVSLSNVDWANGAKFMQVELDLGNGFVDIGTQQLLSVPYALQSATSDVASNGFSNVTSTGDTLYLANGNFLIVPGISAANDNGGVTTTGTTLHTCGTPNTHNPNLTYGIMTDQEGNFYKTIVIGTQEWMAENLKTSVYRNGDLIPTSLDSAAWQGTTSGAWVYYNNDENYACPFGKLYNWFACMDPRQLCPLGWHVPSDAEWTVLTTYLGGTEVAGRKMKTTGTIEANTGIWYEPNFQASNSSGFSGVPGGVRLYGTFNNIGQLGSWWSSTETVTNVAWNREFYFDQGYIDKYPYDGNSAFSVRCLRD